MKKKLLCRALLRSILGIILTGALLFLPAGTLGYWQAWLLIAILFLPMLCAGAVMLHKNPDLLQKRLNMKEAEPEQRQAVLLSGLLFAAAFIVAGLNIRFQGFVLPAWMSYAGASAFLLAYALYAEVLRENAFLSRTVEIQENQRVIDTGLYGIVRHPMYMATLFLFLSMPIVLGCALSFFILLLYLPIIAKRIRNEERVLERGLDGYAEYKARVKHKLLPYIW